MGKTWILMVTCAVMLSGMEAFACTGLLVGKKASVDGSVMRQIRIRYMVNCIAGRLRLGRKGRCWISSSGTPINR
jgi:hypothetical protein